MNIEKCKCGASGFEPSILGEGYCEFCDGTFNGEPPLPWKDRALVAEGNLADARADIDRLNNEVERLQGELDAAQDQLLECLERDE